MASFKAVAVVFTGILMVVGIIYAAASLPLPTGKVLPTYMIKLKSPVYLFAGRMLTGETATVHDLKVYGDLKTLACVEESTTALAVGRYGACGYVFETAHEALVSKTTFEPWGVMDLYSHPVYLLANFKQKWFVGAYANNKTMLDWRPITDEVEDHIARELKVQVKQEKLDPMGFAPGGALVESVNSLLGTQVSQFVYVYTEIPTCGTSTWSTSDGYGMWSLPRDKFIEDWSPLFKWRLAEDKKWKIFSSRPQHNMFHVQVNRKGDPEIIASYEHPGLTGYLPSDNLNVWGVVPTVL